MKNITPRMFRRTLTTLALTSMLASLTACTGTTTAMDTAIRQPQVTATARTDTNLPDHIVNGDFEYPSIAGHATGKIMDGYAWWAYILPDEGASQTDQRKAPKTITEFDANRFG